MNSRPTLTHLYSYPLKSCAPIALGASSIWSTGLPYDRHFAAVHKGIILTGREFPELLQVSAKFTEQAILLSHPKHGKLEVSLTNVASAPQDLKIFNSTTAGYPLSEEASAWISSILGKECQLVSGISNLRPVSASHGGSDGDQVAYADLSPLLLITQSSLADLNGRLKRTVTARHFRPNFIVSGTAPYEEDSWSSIAIDGCTFDVHYYCPRCIFTTIDPQTGKRNADGEPLRTLSTYRQSETGKVKFGIYLIPRKLGTVSVGANVEVVQGQ